MRSLVKSVPTPGGGALRSYSSGENSCLIGGSPSPQIHSPTKSGVSLFHTPSSGLYTYQVQGPGVGKQTCSFKYFSVFEILKSRSTRSVGQCDSKR